nr:uncharacterized protein LOC112934440 [Vulpes vulpes]
MLLVVYLKFKYFSQARERVPCFCGSDGPPCPGLQSGDRGLGFGGGEALQFFPEERGAQRVRPVPAGPLLSPAQLSPVGRAASPQAPHTGPADPSAASLSRARPAHRGARPRLGPGRGARARLRVGDGGAWPPGRGERGEHKQEEQQAEGEGEAGSPPSREPDMGLDPRPWDHDLSQRQAPKLLNHSALMSTHQENMMSQRKAALQLLLQKKKRRRSLVIRKKSPRKGERKNPLEENTRSIPMTATVTLT